MATVAYKRRMVPVQFLKARPVVWSWTTTVTIQVCEWLNRAKFRKFLRISEIFFYTFLNHTNSRRVALLCRVRLVN